MRRKIYAAIIIVLATILGVQSPMYAYNDYTIAASSATTVNSSVTPATAQTVGINPATTTTSNTDIAAVKEDAEEVQTMPNPSVEFKAWRDWYENTRADSYEDENVFVKKLNNRVIHFQKKASMSFQEFFADINIDVPYAFDVQTSVATSKATYTPALDANDEDIMRWHLGGFREYSVSDLSGRITSIIAVNDYNEKEEVYYTLHGAMYYSELISPDSEIYNLEVPNFVKPYEIEVNPRMVIQVYTCFDTVQSRYSLLLELSSGDIIKVDEGRVKTLAKNCNGIILSEECLVVKVGDSGSARYFDYLTKVKKQ